MQRGLIFDIKRYAINDGPGIRMTVFFKGCPLRCQWCHNPESISPEIQKLYTNSKCIGCSECVVNCPEEACELTAGGIITDTEKCTTCGICATLCPADATEISGRYYTVNEIMIEAEQETVFFDQSGGGITFSGGEPLYQPEFLLALLEACEQQEIHRVVDTTGLARTEVLMEVAKKTNLFLYDLKVMDEEKHKKFTGVSNRKILSNLKTLADSGANINLRMPLIKGVNSDEENLINTAKFIADLSGDPKPVSLLPYHNIAVGKHEKLGQIYDENGLGEVSVEEQQFALDIFSQYGVQAQIGG